MREMEGLPGTVKTLEELKEVARQGINLLSLFDRDLDTPRKMLSSLLSRLDEERFHLAVLGQFKRGKSTFLNAIVGENILPSSVVPLTAIPTSLRKGDEPEVQVIYLSGRKEKLKASSPDEIRTLLDEFVTEEKNPRNEKEVSQVVVRLKSPILEKGVVLIDTPGIGSTFRHNTEVTINFLAECDAALFMVSADPPITEVEIEFLREVKKKVTRLFFVLNKVDYLTEEEREKVRDFVLSVLTDEVGYTRPKIFLLSAREGLRAKREGDVEKWRESGMAEIEEFLVNFLAREKEKVFVEAMSKKVSDTLMDVRMRLSLILTSFQLPLEELERKVTLFNEKLKEVERKRTAFEDLIRGERKRTVEFLEEQAEILRSAAREYLESVLDRTISEKRGEKNLEKLVREAIASSIPGYFERILGEMSRKMDHHVSEVLKPYEAQADDLINSIRQNAAELFEVPYSSLEGASQLIMEKEPYWVTHKWSSSLSFVPEGAIDAFLPGAVRTQRVKKRMMKHVEELVLHNVENLRWVTLQNIDKTFRRFTSALDERMKEALEATKGAMEAAVKRRREKAQMAAEEIEKLKQAEEKVNRLIAQLEGEPLTESS
ncbi:MAG: Dynamin family protein [Deltaproteobacteria bacterium]|nr:MAG: Dynamin family protein [Deltaproteobacteria bacterium]